MGGVLQSLSSMASTEIVGENAKTKVVEMACKLWAYHSGVALNALQQTDATPRSQEVAPMLDGVDPNNAEHIKRLTAVWSYIASRMNDEERAHTAVEILSLPMQGNDEKPDLCFHVWIEAAELRQTDLLRRLMASDQLNDEQRKRAWLQAVDRSESLRRAFFEEVLLIGFKVPDSPETMRAMVDAQDKISRLFSTRDQRYILGKDLLEAFVAVSSIEIQNRLIEWIRLLDTAEVLKELQHLRAPTEEELEVLKKAFPKSRHLKKIHAEG